MGIYCVSDETCASPVQVRQGIYCKAPLEYEDFTTFTEVDPNNHINIASAQHIDHAAYRNESAYVYKDFGVDHFHNFTHKIKAKSDLYQEYGLGYVWGLSNTINDLYNGHPSVGVYFYRIGDSNRYISLLEIDSSGTQYGDDYLGASADTWYYIKIVKNGTALNAYIYSDSDYSNLVNTLSLTLQSDYSFRYLYACSTYNDSQSYYQNNDIENFDLGE